MTVNMTIFVGKLIIINQNVDINIEFYCSKLIIGKQSSVLAMTDQNGIISVTKMTIKTLFNLLS